MKKYFLLLIFPLFLLSCGESEEEIRLKAKLDSMEQAKTTVDLQNNDYMKAFNEIQANLDEIKAKEKIISTQTSGDVELNTTDKESINEDINSIYDLMLENKKKIAYLRNKLKSSGGKTSQFKKTIERLTNQMEEKEGQVADLKALLEKKDFDLAALNDKVEDLSTDITELEGANQEKDNVIIEKDNDLHTAYYVMGEKKELIKTGVISIEGKFLSKKAKVQSESDKFIKIDTRTLSEIPLKSYKKVKFLSSHPDGSYEFVTDKDGKYEVLKITNPEKFWKMSKYLVITVSNGMF